ncbi:hypothetical protein PC119_g19780 [Phytophthora cactorum]|uniref:Uncharacterized protein n=1 Tax=Phytophthora cactorum TaxID=29920 RepID=A0A8T1BDB5_9STRA|nr:hypothetical protein PC114_g22359 [Phytophthora cactorum]KAG2899684.1 hypothetical protein PC117_g22163 [Phytophthora cactorum]KAG2986945.1 hypothetical protein PC119_g19780 [Phytophthora cactorum]KAG3133110.1 hypothetical protein C6341_g22672 [Phytophthora cactorum]KAG3156168.1 hypothetical protein PC128_g21936 [Phytophthora cactorum]
MKATGIPPHVELYKQLLQVQASIDKLPPVILQGISNLIEEKGVAAGNITKQMLETTIESLLERVGLAHTEYPTATTTVSSMNGENVYYYEGKFHLLPQTFEFPRTGPFDPYN